MMDGDLGIGRVVDGALGLVRRNLALFAIVGLIVVGLPDLASEMLAPAAGWSTAFASHDVISGLASLAAAVAMLFGRALIIRAALDDLSGRPATAASALAGTLERLFPILGVGLLGWIAVVVGLVLLVVPGLMIYCVLAVALPAAIAERQSVFAAFERSRELTLGYRWKIFWITLAVTVAESVAFGGGGIGALLSPEGSYVRPLIASIGAAISAVVDAAIATSFYAELRTLKEGGMTEQLVAVFE